MKKSLHLKKLNKRIDRQVSRPFTVEASRIVDRLMLQVRISEGRP